MTFDTVRFKVLNLSDYADLAFNLTKGERVTIGGMRFKEMSNRWEEIKEDEFIAAKLTSASYEINFSINISANYVLFEFSIPKYIYGHNLEHYPISAGNELGDLKDFFTTFFLHEFKLPIRLSDIEILRIDMSYNYVFETWDNKEIFKQHTADMMRKAFGESNVTVHPDNNTVTYHTLDYSFKIYDKGPEFMKHDYNKIRDYYGREKADELALRASKIMRAEITYRKRKISYEFFNDIKHTKQVNDFFRGKFIALKKDRDRCISWLESLANKLNQLVIKNWDDEKIDKEFAKLKNDKWLMYSQMSFDPILNTAKTIRERGRFAFKNYTEADLRFLLKKRFQQQIKQYNAIVAPKPIKLELTKFERAFCKSTKPHMIELDLDLMNRLIKKFKDIYREVNSFQLSKMTPLMALNVHRNKVIELGFDIKSIRRYLVSREKYTGKELVKRGVYDRSQVWRLEKQITEIDSLIYGLGGKGAIRSLNIPEKMQIPEDGLKVSSA